MDITKIVLLGALGALGLPQDAAAQPLAGVVTGPYLGAALGVNFRADADLRLRGAGAAWAAAMGVGDTGRLAFDEAGVAALGSLGWGFGNGLRAEAEFSYRRNAITALTLPGIPGRAPPSGSANTYAVMANALYDIARPGWRLGGPGGVPVTPYLGLGAGFAWSAYRRIVTRTGEDGAATYGADGRFAYQAMLGLAWDLSRLAPGLSLTTEYRYLGMLDQSVELGAKLGHQSIVGARVEAENHNHAILVGLRYAFRSGGR